MDKKHDVTPLNGKAYQDITSYDRWHMPRHALDWSNVPRQTKSYPSLPKILLEPNVDLTGKSFWQVMETSDRPFPKATVEIQSLSTVLRLAYGYTARQRAGSQEYLYRSVPSAGALYPVEIYVCGNGIPGLPTGLFHYDIQNFSLRQLRGEDASALITQTLNIPPSENGWVSFILSGIFFRSSWKYRQRAFRYVMLDTGHLIDNIVSALAFVGLSCAIRYDFLDEHLCSLVGLDRHKEACFAILDVRPDKVLNGTKAAEAAAIAPMALDAGVMGASRVSSHEVTFGAVKQIYFTSCEYGKDRSPIGKMTLVTLPEPRQWLPVKQPDIKGAGMDYVGVIQGRRSKRNFVREPISVESFMGLLSLVGGLPRPDMSAEAGVSPVTTGFLVGHVEEIDQGFYQLAGETGAYGLLQSGSFVEKMAGVCLDQLWLANAGALFLFMTNLKMLDDVWGARAYRYAMMDAGRLGQRLYLGSTALGLGCCGIGAFYDNEARELLSLNADSYLLYLVAVGKVKK